MDRIWTICNVIVYGFELIVFGMMVVGLIGFIEGGKFNNPTIQAIFDVLFKIEIEDDEAL